MTVQNPRITVLMPVRNAGEFLEQTLESIWRQSFRDFELLVVDDASSDRTPEILAACRDSRLRVVRNESRLKLSGALNRGLKEARGEYIARMDADDLMRRRRLEWQLAFMEQNPGMACCGGWMSSFGQNPRKTMRFPSGMEDIRAFSLFYTPFAHPSVMFRRDCFMGEQLNYDVGFYPAEDYELWSRVIPRFPCGNLSRVLVDYRVHGGSMTGGEWSEMDAQTVRVQRCILNWLELAPSEAEARTHRLASMGLLPAVQESFDSTEAWLLKIETANRKLHVFEAAALADILNYVWFRMAMGTMKSMGGRAWLLYRNSSLGSWGRHALQRKWLVRASALKHRLTGLSG
ncbi:MAG TPA: glycosyltransferase [Kiritimatiellia bacterium]|nr:glycosyltransferase [Kiritimatiellia bacterium]